MKSEVAKYVNKQPIEISMKSETHFEIASENDAEKELYLLCTVPYDDNWEIRVDGEKVAADSGYGEFIAIRVTPGKHNINLKYIPREFLKGVAIRGGMLTVIILYFVIGIIRTKIGKIY